VVRYSIGTHDWELGAYTPQTGLAVPWHNVSLWGLKAALKDLRRLGYTADRTRTLDGSYVSDTDVLVERTNGRSEAKILEDWKRG